MKHTNRTLTAFAYGPFIFGLLLFVCLYASSVSAIESTLEPRTSEEAEIILPVSEKDDYKIETKADKLIISFNRSIAGNLGKASKNLNNFVAFEETSSDGKSITLSMKMPINVKNKIQNGNLIIRISKQKDNAKQQKGKKSTKNIKVVYGNHEKFARFVFEYDKKPNYSVKNENDKTVVSFPDNISLKMDGLTNYPDHNRIEKHTNKQGGLDFIIPSPLLQSFEYKNKLVLDFAKPQPQSTETDEKNGNRSTIKKSITDNTSENPLRPKDEVASLSFSWNMPVGAAVFRRGEYIWVIFDHTRTTDLNDIRRQSEKVVDEVIQIPHKKGVVLRFKPKKNVKVGLRQEGLLWIIDLYTHDTQYKINELPVFIQHNSQKQAYLYIPTTNAGNIISVVDPDIGDSILTAPNVELGVGINSDYKYPDLEILPSAQGLAIIPNISDLDFSRGNTGISIKAINRGLNISGDLENMKRQQSLGQDSSEGFGLNVPPQLLKLDFTAAEDRLKNDIANAAPEKKTDAKLQLAKYYISQGLGTNALKLLNALRDKKDPVASGEKFHALHGVANFLAKRYDDAIDDFSFGDLPNRNEAVFWRTLASSAQEFEKENNIVLTSFISVIKDYPQELKERIALIAADTAIKANDDISAQNFMDILKSSKGNINRKAHIQYLNAKKSELQGYPRNALRQYGGVIPMNSQKYSSLARFEKISLELKLKLTGLDKAIAELERIRYAWGEPKFKLNLLETLAGVYARNKDYYNALKTYQEALTIAEPTQKQDISDKMVKLFEEIYLKNGADDISPLKALAMYQDFEWLAPRSKHYSKIVQKLADRLVAVDLLPRAEEMLKEQLRLINLENVQKAQIGARLALIYLFQEENMAALDVLAKTEIDNMPENLGQYRKIIRAQALSSLNRDDEALELLEDENSKNALLLKSGIYWKAARWDKAADTLKYLIEKPVKDKPLSEEQINYILDWATALKKAGRETVIVRLRNKFLPYFAKTPYYSTFNILTNSLEADKIDLKAISQAVDDVAAYSNFSKLYNQSLRDTTLPKATE